MMFTPNRNDSRRFHVRTKILFGCLIVLRSQTRMMHICVTLILIQLDDSHKIIAATRTVNNPFTNSITNDMHFEIALFNRWYNTAVVFHLIWQKFLTFNGYEWNM